ncbi:MAG TPA: hypothetical protein VH170_03720 [Chthoniobacterales bacterium]|nr:hypothetical protein [Chthoniobacterales bacterium]
MKRARAQFFSALALLFASILSIFAQATVGQKYQIAFADVDGNSLSTADGRVNVVVVTSQANIDKARAVGDRTPDFCLANPSYRMITVVEFETKHTAPIRAVARSVIRHRLNSEAHRLKNRYDKLKITRDARRDVFAVADFDGTIATQLGLKSDAALFHVFVFGKGGELLKQWSEAPNADELEAALR